jgi:hypothetical protein
VYSVDSVGFEFSDGVNRKKREGISTRAEGDCVGCDEKLRNTMKSLACVC